MIARLYTGCNDIVSLRNSYHGNAAGTMGATGQSNWKFSVIQVITSVGHLEGYTSDSGNNWRAIIFPLF